MFKPNLSKHECIWRGVSFAGDFWITMGIRIPAEIQMETKGSQPYLSCQEEPPIDVCGSAEANGRQGKIVLPSPGQLAMRIFFLLPNICLQWYQHTK